MADINFEDIQPFVEGQGDSGLTARQKIKRNFERVKRIVEELIASVRSMLNGKVDKNNSVETSIKDNSRLLKVTDKDGNIITRTGDIGSIGKGIQSNDFFDKEGNSIVNKILDLEVDSANLEERIEHFEKDNRFLPTSSSKQESVADKSEVFYVVDGGGNVIAKLNSDGLETVRIKANEYVNAENENIIQLILSQVGIESIVDKKKSELYVTDNDGNVVFKISDEGIEATKIKADFFEKINGGNIGNEYADWNLYTIGDSLSAGGTWQAKVASILGLSFDNSINAKPGQATSVGGTTTSGGALDSAFFRAKNLYDQNVVENNGDKSVIILQCANDISSYNPNSSGSIGDMPLMPTTPYELNANELTTEVLNGIPSANRELNKCVTVLRPTTGKRLTITNLPTSEGDVLLSLTWSAPGKKDYYIHVTPQSTVALTMQHVIEKILEYNYTRITDIDGGDGESVIFSHGYDMSTCPLTVEFTDVGNTGMTCSVTDGVSASVKSPRFFIGESLNDWGDTTKWVTGNYINMYRGWKSVIQYLKLKFPKAFIVIVHFPNHRATQSDYLLPNGLYDEDAFYDSDNEDKVRTFAVFLKEIAQYYSIPFIDVNALSGITISNITAFYYSTANVHPKVSGYERFGEIVAQQLKKYLPSN